MKRKFASTGVLFMVLTVALASLAVAYTQWSTSLTINGTVNTGEVDAEFVFAFTDDDDFVDDVLRDAGDDDSCADLGGVDDAGSINQLKDGSGNDMTSCDPKASGPNPERYLKDVARCDADIDLNGDGVVELVNAYPSYYCTAWFDIHNNGDIPVKVTSVVVDSTALTGCPTYTGLDLNNDNVDDIEICLSSLTVTQQIDPSETVPMDLDIHVLDGAPQGTSNMAFSAGLVLTQWNAP